MSHAAWFWLGFAFGGLSALALVYAVAALWGSQFDDETTDPEDFEIDEKRPLAAGEYLAGV